MSSSLTNKLPYTVSPQQNCHIPVSPQQNCLIQYHHSQTALYKYHHSKTAIYQYHHSKTAIYQYHHSKTALYSITTAKLPYTLVTPQTNYHTSHVSTYLGLVCQFLFMLQCLFIFFFRSYGFHLGCEADSFLTHLVLLQSRVETQLNA